MSLHSNVILSAFVLTYVVGGCEGRNRLWHSFIAPDSTRVGMLRVVKRRSACRCALSVWSFGVGSFDEDLTTSDQHANGTKNNASLHVFCRRVLVASNVYTNVSKEDHRPFPHGWLDFNLATVRAPRRDWCHRSSRIADPSSD